MTKYNTIPDADLSSAGDDFHIVWAIKKSLDLLNFDEKGLKAVTIEGVEENASKKLDPTGEKFLGIDLSKYYFTALVFVPLRLLPELNSDSLRWFVIWLVKPFLKHFSIMVIKLRLLRKNFY